MKDTKQQSEKDFLAQYDPRALPPVAVTVDIVLLTVRHGRFSVLLLRRGDHPEKGRWALPGGFVGQQEDLIDAAIRELQEETGIENLPGEMHLEQLRTFGEPGRDPRMRVVSVAYVAFLPDLPPPRAGSDAALSRFWPVGELSGPDAPDLAFDHASIIAEGIDRARAKIEYTPLAAAFLEEPFTLSDLRAIYEEVWAMPQDPSNFRRKVLRLEGFVTPVGGIAPPKGPQGGRPAELYRKGPAKILWPPLRRHDPSENGSLGEDE
ncbi:MAG: NUDIX domain-containing protein [Candidatus Dormibacteraeota bacterium]|uniref:NUDIX domain-containing protein n=1 Tax=Candidatus Dormiibacter inghamiae TaxID=3127013 RepID=A0A934NGM0_9BACT|nr:NUDIX domain-containing protein [Candidatus Dormibacteraeota bacterium]MBJ7604955.1 NUDIX domain-containing protein [Candidatus Dormibacteraeota bacterium]